jgi:hypothetical protein
MPFRARRELGRHLRDTTLAALGIALYVIFSAIEYCVTGWAVRRDDFGAVA